MSYYPKALYSAARSIVEPAAGYVPPEGASARLWGTLVALVTKASGKCGGLVGRSDGAGPLLQGSLAPAPFFVVGAAKGGTTFLHDYFLSHPEVFLRRVKEIHFFDRTGGVNDQVAKQLRVWLKQKIHRVEKNLKVLDSEVTEDVLFIRDAIDWLNLIDRPDADLRDYLAFISPSEAMGGSYLRCGDITPGYATMTGSKFREMVSIHPGSKFVFVMRDPVDRLWSHLRMQAKILRHRKVSDTSAVELANELLQPQARITKIVAPHSNYMRTIDALRENVPETKIGIFFYERLFDEADSVSAFRELTNFLGLAPHVPTVEKALNAGDSTPLPEEVECRLREWLDPQYKRLANVVPDDVKSKWRM
ncbi:sulfotransferase [Ruegeria pomeroyi]|nr:sulfotransferase [Ruegeria pomeroyi]